MKEASIYYPDGSTATREEVRRKLLLEELAGDTTITQNTPFPATRDFDTWTEVLVRQQRDRQELLGIPEHVEVDIGAKSPFLLALIADSHMGGAEVDYERFAKDINLIHDAKGYSITVGDLTDSFFFMPEVGTQLISGDEQVLFAQSALDKLADGDRLIAGFGGDHDMWGADKHGAHTMYQRFRERYNSHYLEGVSYVTLRVNDIPLGFVGSHRHKGFSVYNDAHASLRQWRDEGVGAVVSFTAHNHVKAALSQVHKVHGGKEVLFHSLALGAYKQSDRYSRKMGWPRKGEQAIGAFGLVIEPDGEFTVHWTVAEAVDRLGQIK
jgi:hypothetical protein